MRPACGFGFISDNCLERQISSYPVGAPWSLCMAAIGIGMGIVGLPRILRPIRRSGDASSGKTLRGMRGNGVASDHLVGESLWCGSAKPRLDAP
jgi:hypothetical protein